MQQPRMETLETGTFQPPEHEFSSHGRAVSTKSAFSVFCDFGSCAQSSAVAMFFNALQSAQSTLLVLREAAFRIASWQSKWHADMSSDVLRAEPFNCKMLPIFMKFLTN